MARGASIKYTPEQLAFIEANCSTERKALTEMVNVKFSTTFSVDNIKSLCTRKKWKTGRTGHFPKGLKSWNKGTKGLVKPNSGSFKKDQNPWNHKPVGHERICNKEGYVHVKTAEPDVFELKHRVVWVATYGPIPDDYVVAFRNMDKTDCRAENLILLNRSELARYNQTFKKIATPETNESCLILAKIKSKKFSLMRAIK